MYGDESAFGLTKDEMLWDKVSNRRFEEFVDDPTSEIRRVDETENDYGEWLFVTIVRNGQCLTFYGLGENWRREVWINKVWFFYSSHARDYPTIMEKDHAKRLIDARRAWVAPYVEAAKMRVRSAEARAFSFLADLTDEDGASTELEDNPGIIDLFGGMME